MKKSRWTLTLALGFMVAGLTIGGIAYVNAPSAVAQTSPWPATLAFMPASASVVGHLDLRSLMESPMRAQWEEQMNQEGGPGFQGLEDFRTATGLDPFTDLYGLTFSMEGVEEVVTGSMGGEGARPAPERWGIALSGNFDPARLIATMREHEVPEEVSYENTTLYLVKNKTDSKTQAFAFPEGTVGVFGDPDYVRAMLDAGAGRGESAEGHVLSRWDGGTLSGETFWLAANIGEGLNGMWKMPQGGELPPLQALLFSGRMDSDFALRARGQAADPESAQKLADVVRGFVALGALQQNAEPDVAAIIDSIQIAQLENEIDISLSVPYETLQRLSERGKDAEAAAPEPQR